MSPPTVFKHAGVMLLDHPEDCSCENCPPYPHNVRVISVQDANRGGHYQAYGNALSRSEAIERVMAYAIYIRIPVKPVIILRRC